MCQGAPQGGMSQPFGRPNFGMQRPQFGRGFGGTSGYHPFQRQQPTPMQSKPFMEGQTGGLHPYQGQQPAPTPDSPMIGSPPWVFGKPPPPPSFSGIPAWANQNNGDTRWDSRAEAMNAKTGGMHPHTPNVPQMPTANVQGAPAQAPAPGAPSSWNGFNEQTFTGPSGSRQFTWDPSQSGISADGMLAQIGQLGRGNPANLNVLFKDAMGKQIGGGGMGKVGNSYLMGLKPGQQYTMEWSGAGPEGFRMGGNPRTWDQTPWIPKSPSGPSFWR